MRRVIIENGIIRLFPVDAVIRLLERYCKDYKGLLINLCEPVIVNAVGRALIGIPPNALHITDGNQQKLSELFKQLTASKARLALTEAAGYFCKEAHITDKSIHEYIANTAVDLYPRISAALPTGNLSGIFISLD